MVGAVGGWLERLADLPAAKATGAYPNALCRAVNNCADTLKIGVKCPFRLVIGVTYVMA